MSTPVSPEVARALELARKKYGPNLEGAIASNSGMPKGHKVHPRQAFASGVENKRLGMGRVSPYYNAPHSDHFWFAGYDGKTIQEAIESQ